jgi:hypothetical protein
MNEAGPQPLRGGENDVPSLESIDKLLAKELNRAGQELEIIGESLRALAQRVERERPDALVFLDLSARILGTPYQKYLTEKMGKDAPLVRFYNDHYLKGAFLEHEALDELVQKDFEPMRGKKVFFIDETFSEGKGAAALLEASELAGIEGYYFALSKDPEPESSNILNTEHESFVRQNVNDGRIVIYDHTIKNLFSRFTSRLYIKDVQHQTLPLQVSREKALSSNTIPNANNYMRPPKGMSMEEWQLAASTKFDTATRQVKEMIYQALIKEKK